VIFLLFIFGTCITFGCSCDLFENQRKTFWKAKVVFVGKVIDSDLKIVPPEEIKGDVAKAVKFKIEKSWKGTKLNEVTVWLTKYSVNCSGFEVTEGESYLIYAYKYKNNLIFNLFCSRSQKIKKENEDLTKELKNLDSIWFRFWSRLNPF